MCEPVTLHGYVRTTVAVDVFMPESPAGYLFSRSKPEYCKENVPVHFVFPQQLRIEPQELEDREGVRTVGLADLINMKLESGTRDPLRAIDLADVIGLVRANKLSATYASKLAKDFRPEFRKLATAIAKEMSRPR